MSSPAATSTPQSETRLGYAWYVAIILMLCNTLSFIDRQVLGLLVDPIKQDLQISDTRIGLLQGLAFALFYTALGLPMGRIADRGNRRNLISIGIFFWSLMTALCALAQNFLSLFLTRMGVGIGEATLSPSAFSLISDYFPKERLGTALSVFSMGIFFGSGLALIVGGLVIGAVGSWRLTFVIVGLPGIVMALLALTIKEPTRKNLLTTKTGEFTKLSIAEVIHQIKLRWQSVAGICIGFAFQALCNYAQQAWLPSYFRRVHGWAPKQTGLTLGLISLAAGLLGNYAGGWLCDYWQMQRKREAPLKVGVLATLCAGAFFSAAMLAPDVSVQLGLLVPAFFFLAMPIGSTYASLQLIFPNQVRAQAGALQVFTLNLGGLVLGPLLPGLFNDYIFRDPNRVGYSLALTVGLASLLSAILFRSTYGAYRKHYALMQEGTSK
ncbi:MAG: MFS transporter [Acidobacteria bacterium]|nr:MFS transporter [Acidobacteriota bacterium]